MSIRDLLSLISILAVMAGILAGAYYFTRWMGKGFALPGLGSQNLRVLDRINVGKDQSILVVRAGERYFLVGAAPSGVGLLAELSPEEGAVWERTPGPEAGPKPGTSAGFQQLFQKILEKKKD